MTIQCAVWAVAPDPASTIPSTAPRWAAGWAALSPPGPLMIYLPAPANASARVDLSAFTVVRTRKVPLSSSNPLPQPLTEAPSPSAPKLVSTSIPAQPDGTPAVPSQSHNRTNSLGHWLRSGAPLRRNAPSSPSVGRIQLLSKRSHAWQVELLAAAPATLVSRPSTAAISWSDFDTGADVASQVNFHTPPRFVFRVANADQANAWASALALLLGSAPSAAPISSQTSTSIPFPSLIATQPAPVMSPTVTSPTSVQPASPTMPVSPVLQQSSRPHKSGPTLPNLDGDMSPRSKPTLLRRVRMLPRVRSERNLRTAPSTGWQRSGEAWSPPVGSTKSWAPHQATTSPVWPSTPLYTHTQPSSPVLSTVTSPPSTTVTTSPPFNMISQSSKTSGTPALSSQAGDAPTLPRLRRPASSSWLRLPNEQGVKTQGLRPMPMHSMADLHAAYERSGPTTGGALISRDNSTLYTPSPDPSLNERLSPLLAPRGALQLFNGTDDTPLPEPFNQLGSLVYPPNSPLAPSPAPAHGAPWQISKSHDPTRNIGPLPRMTSMPHIHLVEREHARQGRSSRRKRDSLPLKMASQTTSVTGKLQDLATPPVPMPREQGSPWAKSPTLPTPGQLHSAGPLPPRRKTKRNSLSSAGSSPLNGNMVLPLASSDADEEHAKPIALPHSIPPDEIKGALQCFESFRVRPPRPQSNISEADKYRPHALIMAALSPPDRSARDKLPLPPAPPKEGLPSPSFVPTGPTPPHSDRLVGLVDAPLSNITEVCPSGLTGAIDTDTACATFGYGPTLSSALAESERPLPHFGPLTAT